MAPWALRLWPFIACKNRTCVKSAHSLNSISTKYTVKLSNGIHPFTEISPPSTTHKASSNSVETVCLHRGSVRRWR